jgi:ribA/ribD-fused uncharacterized protein
MEKCSYFIFKKALFGSYPTQEAVYDLEKIGVRFFIDLTFNTEKKITPYKTSYTYINFPIADHDIPRDWKEFACFIIKISDIIHRLVNDDLLLIHCKGGHGRSGILVASLLTFILKISPLKALEMTSEYHKNRPVMREKWRKLGSPHNKYQKQFVVDFFTPIIFYRAYSTGLTAGFSNFTPHSVTLENFGTFHTVESALQAYKNPTDKEYIKSQEETVSPIISINIGRKIVCKDWYEICDKVIMNVLKCKFDQHDEIKNNLLSTGLRPIIQHTRTDNYWGDGGDGHGKNKLGISLVELREIYYRENI